jgi:SAM-dependent methyltransferase
MADLQDLTPAERASQLGKPEGDVGLAIAAWMNGYNRPFIAASYRALALEAGSRILEIGFGNGHDVPDLLARAEAIDYVGLDVAPTMVAEAARFNHDAVASGKARFHLGRADAMPFAPSSFDRVIAVNVIYFWPDPVPPLVAIRRVLRPGGLCVIGASDPASQSDAVARPEYGFHRRDADTVLAAHRQAGFSSVAVEVVERDVTRNDGTAARVSFNVFVAKI